MVFSLGVQLGEFHPEGLDLVWSWSTSVFVWVLKSGCLSQVSRFDCVSLQDCARYVLNLHFFVDWLAFHFFDALWVQSLLLQGIFAIGYSR